MFDMFWADWPTHPRKVNRKGCLAIWRSGGLDEQAGLIMPALRLWKASDEWAREDGQYVPMPSTWLRQERWLTKPTASGDDEGPGAPAFKRRRITADEAEAMLKGGAD